MNDLSYKNWLDFSDLALVQQIGCFVKHQRRIMKLSQQELSQKAGISRSTLSLLERGESVNLLSLIQVLRTIDQLQHFMSAFEIQELISPMNLLKEAKKSKRKFEIS